MFVDPFEEVDIQVVLCIMLQLMCVSMIHYVVHVSSYYCRWPNNGMEFIIKFIIILLHSEHGAMSVSLA